MFWVTAMLPTRLLSCHNQDMALLLVVGTDTALIEGTSQTLTAAGHELFCAKSCRVSRRRQRSAADSRAGGTLGDRRNQNDAASSARRRRRISGLSRRRCAHCSAASSRAARNARGAGAAARDEAAAGAGALRRDARANRGSSQRVIGNPRAVPTRIPTWRPTQPCCEPRQVVLRVARRAFSLFYRPAFCRTFPATMIVMLSSPPASSASWRSVSHACRDEVIERRRARI